MDIISEEEKEAFSKLISEKAERIAKKYDVPKSFASPLFIPEGNVDYENIEKARLEFLKELKDFANKNAI